MNTNIRKTHSGEAYEIQYVVHPRPITHGCDVYACYRLSKTDGMPIGGLVWIAKTDFEPVWFVRTRTDNRLVGAFSSFEAIPDKFVDADETYSILEG